MPPLISSTPSAPGLPRPDLDAIQARCDAATAGPWEQWREHPSVYYDVSENSRKGICAGSEIASTENLEVTYDEAEDEDEAEDRQEREQLANAAFIASARTDLPEVVAYARRLESELVAARKLLKVCASRYKEAIDIICEDRGDDEESEEERAFIAMIEAEAYPMLELTRS